MSSTTSSVAVAVTASDRDTKTVLYVDPETGLLQGSDEVLLKYDPEASGGLDLKLPAVRSFISLSESRRIAPSDVPRK